MPYEVDMEGQDIAMRAQSNMPPIVATLEGLNALAKAAGMDGGQTFLVQRTWLKGRPTDVVLPDGYAFEPARKHALLKRAGADGVVVVLC